jgi:hypothetical protein
MITLCEPYITKEMRASVFNTMMTRWIGQAHKVDMFEKLFQEKLGTDCMVQKNWDKILIDEIESNTLLVEAYSVDTEPGEEPVPPAEEKTYGKDWSEMNCCIFSPMAMNHNWQFSMVPHSVDIHLSRHLRTVSGDMNILETTRTWVTHYRGTSRSNYDK